MYRFDKRVLGERTTNAFSAEVAVRFQDVDAAGIVFFARFFDYVHGAYEGFLASAGLPLPQVLRDRSWAAPLRHAEADYLRPARFGDVLLIELVAAQSDESEVTLGWRIISKGQPEKPCAIIQTVHTFVRPDDFRRISVPSEISQKLQSVLIFPL